jgi:hypothetical protein
VAEPIVDREAAAAEAEAKAEAGERVVARPVVRRARKESRVWRRTTMRRAAAEAVGIFAVGRLLAMVPIAFWPAAIYPLAQVALLFLGWIIPPWWAAMRVVSTRREKMSPRFWLLGPQLAALCALADAVISLALGEASLLTGPSGRPDFARLLARGQDALSLTTFIGDELKLFFILLVFYTLFVVCTRLANGGFMRFTMPAGDGRVTL